MNTLTDTVIDKSIPLTLTEEDLERFIDDKVQDGLNKATASKYRSQLRHLCRWLPEDKIVTKERLLKWRSDFKDAGYSKITVEKYVTVINLYTKHFGYPQLHIKKSTAYDISGRRFGYLTAIEATEKRSRRDVIWRCVCKCGKETEVPASLLVRGNTTSCGCLSTDIFDYYNRYVEGTELRKSMEDNTFSTRAASGYTGVTRAKGKWHAYITYKKKTYNLGYYSKLEDAVKARARGKEEVMEDAARLYEATDYLYKEKPGRPRQQDISTNFPTLDGSDKIDI